MSRPHGGIFCASNPNPNVKTSFIVLVVLTFFVFPSKAHALFGHVQAEKERRQDAEQRVIQEQQTNGRLMQTNQGLHITISLLSAGVTVALVIGAVVGSKARRDAQRP